MSSEFLKNWNEIIQFKIKEHDLNNPNEIFLTNALLHYLDKLNFDLGPLIAAKDSELPANRCKFRIELCAYIDHLYKSGNEASNSFIYYDLICPSPKKTVHLLNFLLNYLFFYNLIKEEVIHTTEKKLSKRNDVLAKKANLLKQNDKNNFSTEKITKTLEEFRTTLQKLELKIKELEVKESEQNDLRKRLEISLDTYKIQLIDIKEEELKILMETITEEEIENLISKKALLIKSIDAQIEIEKFTQISNQDIINSINNLEPLVKKLEKSMNIVDLKDVTKFKELKKVHYELSEKLNKQIPINEKTISLIKKDEENIEKLEKLLNEKKNNLDKIEQSRHKEISDIERKCGDEEVKIEDLDSQRKELNDDLKEQEEITNIIVDSTEKLLHHLISRDPSMLKS